MRAMRAYLPVILVLLAVFTASCIVYIAWELSSDKPDAAGVDQDSDSEDPQ
ncbi:MAG: hypothetical protein OEO82_03795 [Gammaproteobacteria bacterium]|nr:hypothetical protein [Gammaproteobacteria bacterium]